MLYREFGKTGKKVSILGFGCMRFQVVDGQNDKIDEKKAIKQVRYAIDNGVNYIDTAYPYHDGMSEVVTGKALNDGYRDKVYLATKLPSWSIDSREDMDKILNEQLEKLGTDYIDFYLVHALTKKRWENVVKHDVFDFLDKAVKDGIIKYVGFSFHDEYPLFKEIINSYNWDFCQIQYNYMDQNYQAGKEGLKLAKDKNLGIVIMEPLRGGSLVKNVPKDIQDIWDKADIKRTPAEWGLRYLWDHPEISVVLSGMNNMNHIKENIDSAEMAYRNSLTDDEKDIIKEVKNIYEDKMVVGCTDCKYCIPCPEGVDIPECFTQLNNASMYNDIKGAKFHYNILTVKHDKEASRCVECGECEKKCPQNIEIRKMLKKAVNTFER
ncbi:MAG: aldo/keto reductase [Firmicutes bacterium]|nr:aldo/keto reductase [Bacillota bacterium]